MIKYEKTDDKNVVKKILVVESEIRLDVLRKEIEDLERQIEEAPKPKEKPDEETLEFWNAMNAVPIDDLIGRLEEKQEFLRKLEELK